MKNLRKIEESENELIETTSAIRDIDIIDPYEAI